MLVLNVILSLSIKIPSKILIGCEKNIQIIIERVESYYLFLLECCGPLALSSLYDYDMKLSDAMQPDTIVQKLVYACEFVILPSENWRRIDGSKINL